LLELWEALETVGFLEKSQQKRGKASKNEEKPAKTRKSLPKIKGAILQHFLLTFF